MENETKEKLLKIQEYRLLDPINYQEACYRLVWEKRYKNMGIPYERIICWLGSHVGQSFLREVHSLIEKYPFKESCSFVFMNGSLVNSAQLLLHYCWFVEQGTDVEYEKYIEYHFPIGERIWYLMSDGRIVNNEFEQAEPTDPIVFDTLMETVRNKYFKLLNIVL